MSPVTIIRSATVGDTPDIAVLIQGLSHYFLDSPATGQAEAFLASFTPEAIAAHVSDPSFRYLLARVGHELAGIAALRDNRHIHHLFVAPAYHRHGIASQLWKSLKEEAIRSGNIEGFTVNSSLFAAPVYARWGFVATAAPQTRNGVAYQPMRLNDLTAQKPAR